MENLHLTHEKGREKQKQIQEVKHSIASISGHLLLGTVFAALALFLFLKLADEVMEAETLRFDMAAVQYFQQHSRPALHILMFWVSWLASGYSQSTVIILTAIVFLWKRR